MVSYVAGGVPDDSALGDVQASNKEMATLFYTYKDLNTAIGYSEFHNATGVTTAQTKFATANYTYNKFKVAGGYVNFENPSVGAGVANTDFDMYMLSGMYTLTPANEISVGAYKLKDNANHNNGSTQFSLMAKHYLSKRFDVWAGVTSVNNNGASGFGSTSAGSGNASLNSLSTNFAAYPTVAGKVQNTYALGMAYVF